MNDKEYLSENYDWKIYRHQSDVAYQSDIGTENHSLQKNGKREIQFALDLAASFLKKQPRGHALDVACGNGYITNCLTELGFQAKGIDISEEGITAAKAKFENIPFLVCDGTKPLDHVNEKFDLIYIREFHPFKVIQDFKYQSRIIEDYLSLLSDDGIIVIAHGKAKKMAYHGRNKSYPGLEFSRLNEKFNTAGPFYYFAFNHLKVRPNNKALTRLLSLVTGIVANIIRQYWIEYFIVTKHD